MTCTRPAIRSVIAGAAPRQGCDPAYGCTTTSGSVPPGSAGCSLTVNSGDVGALVVSHVDQIPAGVEVFISNHDHYDNAVEKLAAKKGDGPNPFVLGESTVQRALTVMNECAQATLALWNS